MGKLAVGPIFQAGNGSPLNLDNLARRVIVPVLKEAGVSWHGWHAFRRGLGTNLHGLGVDAKTIQAILRHSNVGLTMNVYVKAVGEAQISAMYALENELRANMQQSATPPGTLVN
jgi:integrase